MFWKKIVDWENTQYLVRSNFLWAWNFWRIIKVGGKAISTVWLLYITSYFYIISRPTFENKQHMSIKLLLTYSPLVNFHRYSTCSSERIFYTWLTIWRLTATLVWTWGVPSRSVCEIKDGWSSVNCVWRNFTQLLGHFSGRTALLT